MNPEVFHIAPAASRTLWTIAAIPGLVALLVCGVLAATVTGSRASRFEVSSEGLRLRGDLYGRLIPARSLQIDDARRIDFDATPELTPRRRTMGSGLPGYQAGWFRLRSGERALMYLTDRSRAVYIPTRDGYSVLLSPSEPDAFLASLRRAAGAATP